MADRSEFWQNVDATMPDKVSGLSEAQLRYYQNYFLAVQADYNPGLPQHEANVASERLALLRGEIEFRRVKELHSDNIEKQPHKLEIKVRGGQELQSDKIEEQRHKETIRWTRIGAV